MSEDRAPTAEPVVKLGVRLKQVREKSGLSLREVARQLGVSPSFVSQIENGKSQPSVATLYSMTQLLDVSIDELFAADHAEVADGVPESIAGICQRRDRARASGRRWRGLDQPLRTRFAGRRLAPRAGAGRGCRSPARATGTRLEMDTGVIWEQLANNTGAALDFIEIIYPPHSTFDQRQAHAAARRLRVRLPARGRARDNGRIRGLHAARGRGLGFDSVDAAPADQQHRPPRPGHLVRPAPAR